VTPWHDTWVLLPADGQTVWIRRVNWFSTPVLATWSTSALTFTITTTTLSLSWTWISSWRLQ
jgi:hypothetical protein